MSTLDDLQAWYRRQCDGEWEHQQGVTIDTLDNPGWSVSIDLKGTPHETEPFEAVSVRRSDEDWLDLRVEQGVFRGFGGPGNLEEILASFLSWASRQKPGTQPT
ncbi:MAG: immunity 53 family protein [Planctomycetota bacterium]